jgi:hypothetical protein
MKIYKIYLWYIEKNILQKYADFVLKVLKDELGNYIKKVLKIMHAKF